LDLAEITSPDFPGERLITCRNPVLAADRAPKRGDPLAATEKLLAPIITRVAADRFADAGPIGVEVGEVISRYKTGKHFAVSWLGPKVGLRFPGGRKVGVWSGCLIWGSRARLRGSRT
jgi:hypothetical protein